ncbi:MAG TPA: GntR family transcriptional regulator [Candidatus Dormibacteraeota bacterium]
MSRRARSAILEAILAGHFDERLPPEEELAEMLRVSRTTVRSALLDLEIKGLITRRRARGTTVNAHVSATQLALDRLVGFNWLLQEKGYRVKVELSHVISKIQPEFVNAFAVDPELECCLMTKRYYADGVCAIGIIDAIPTQYLVTRRLRKQLPASVFEFSDRYCNKSINHATVEIVPMVAEQPSVALADSIVPGRGFVRLHETHYTQEAIVMGWSIIDVNDKFVRFSVVRRP